MIKEIHLDDERIHNKLFLLNGQTCATSSILLIVCFHEKSMISTGCEGGSHDGIPLPTGDDHPYPDTIK